MKTLLPLAETIARRLIARRETIAIAESSTGGLVAAALLAVPGASAYFLGETGATGPTGNRYGDPAGHSCMAVASSVERAITLRTGNADRLANMDAFAKRALELLVEAIPAA